MDCEPFRVKAFKHMKSLIFKMEEYPRKEFVQKINQFHNDITNLKVKL